MKTIDIGTAVISYSLYEKVNAPTIVIDVCLGSCSAEWWHIAERWKENYQVLLFDRAGCGQSGKSASIRTPENITKELDELLKRLKIDSDVILVGHSQGGLYAVQFAIMYPQKVKGLILLDPATPFDDEFKEKLTPEEYKNSGVDKTVTYRIGAVLTSLRLGFLIKPLLLKSPPFYYYKFEDEAREYILKSLCRRQSYITSLEEYKYTHDKIHTKAISNAVKTGKLKNIPLTLITHSSNFYIEELKKFGGMSAEAAAKIEYIWQDIMKRYLKLSQNSQYFTAQNSGHYIHLTDLGVLNSVIDY